MNIYYYANQLYEYSFSRPIYERLGGTFVVNKFSRALRFKRYLLNADNFPDRDKKFFNTPPVILRDIKKPVDLDGVIISQSNTTINYDSKRCVSIFMGHGAGDKKYGGTPAPLETYNYHFISGNKHLEKLKDIKVHIPEERQVKIGYPKFDDYVNGRINREKHLKHLGVKDVQRKNILYAPTWKWGNGTLSKYVYSFSRELTREFNLIIRPHFFERKYIPSLKLWTKLNRINHVYFSNPANLLQNGTMNDFAVSDALISDTSSIIYEYLITGNPIVIAESGFSDSHNMPETLDIHKVAETYTDSSSSDILAMVQEALGVPDRRKDYESLLNNCFYFNDGCCTDRAVEFLFSLENR